MSKKVAFYGGCQLYPLINLLQIFYKDKVKIVSPQKYNVSWKKELFCPFEASFRINEGIYEEKDCIKSLYEYFDEADIIITQPFLNTRSLPIGRPYASEEFLHKTIIDKYENKKLIIGGTFFYFKSYFQEIEFNYQLTKIIALLYIKKNLSSSAEILEWLLNETCEEINILFLKNLKQDLIVNEKISNIIKQDFKTYISSYNIQEMYDKHLLCYIPGHPSFVYYCDIFMKYISILFNEELDIEILKTKEDQISHLMHAVDNLYMCDFIFFKSLFPNIILPKTEDVYGKLKHQKITTDYIDKVIFKIKSLNFEQTQSLFSGWA